MVKFEHTKLLRKLNLASTAPDGEDEFNKWIANVPQLLVLIDNLKEDEYIVSALSKYSYIQTAIVPQEQLINPDINNLLGWGIDSTDYRISQWITYNPDKKTYLEENNFLGCESIKKSQSLIFHRTFEGIADSSRDYYELLQEFAHISGIHWRDERSAYCKFDENGDWDNIVSVSKIPIELVTVNRKILDEYLYLSKSAIVRVFDFTLFGAGFNGWNQDNETIKQIENTYYEQSIEPSNGSYTRGFQIITPKDSDKEIYKRVSTIGNSEDKQYAEFTAHDWRNDNVCKISTDPKATTNYFVKKEGFPFELSPAFFKPEVLSKYKADKDKYTVSTRGVACRAAWSLRGIDINEAGQVHAYICDLRKLPYHEQLHWLSFNEKPKTNISKRAFTNDFQASWASDVDPLNKVKRTLKSWHISGVSWWAPKDNCVFENATTPSPDNKSEWENSFLELAKLVIEGFKIKKIKDALRHFGIDYEKENGSIKLLKLLCESEFLGLTEVPIIRNFKGHAKAAESEAYSKKIIKKYGSCSQHFDAVCDMLLAELNIIENRFNEIQ